MITDGESGEDRSITFRRKWFVQECLVFPFPALSWNLYDFFEAMFGQNTEAEKPQSRSSSSEPPSEPSPAKAEAMFRAGGLSGQTQVLDGAG